MKATANTPRKELRLRNRQTVYDLLGFMWLKSGVAPVLETSNNGCVIDTAPEGTEAYNLNVAAGRMAYKQAAPEGCSRLIPEDGKEYVDALLSSLRITLLDWLPEYTQGEPEA